MSVEKKERRVEVVKEAIPKATSPWDLASARVEDLAMAAALVAGENARAIEKVRQHLSGKLPDGIELDLR